MRPSSENKTLVKNFQTIYWEWDFLDGRFKIDALFYKQFPVHQSEILPKQQNIITLLQPLLSLDDWVEFQEKIRTVRQSGKAFTSKWAIKTQESLLNLVLHATPTLAGGKVIQLKGSIAEENLKLSDENLLYVTREIIEKSCNLFLVLNKDYAIVAANPACCQHLGYQLSELISTSILKLDIEHNIPQWNNFLKHLKRGNTLDIETSFQRKDGTIFPITAAATYLEKDNQALVCLLARDISAQRRLESQWKPALIQTENLRIQLEEERTYFQETFVPEHRFENIISKSAAYQKVLQQVKRVAPTDSTVLIEGETGTGKELLARAVHELSRRKKRNLIVVNCASLPKELIESELFGHEEGAFTGANKQKRGRFELADGGTIFLDEIGELPMSMQSNLLRVLQGGTFERVGGTQSITVNVRIIAATNRILLDMIDEGTFREDLYYRLNVFPIRNLPLRERVEDIPLLVLHFIEKYAKKINRQVNRVNKSDLLRLQAYSFPGNVRELENIIERAIILSTGTTLNLDFWQPLHKKEKVFVDFPTLDELQKQHIESALEKCKWKVSGHNGAARLLGMKDQTLFSKMRKYGISK